MPRKNKNKKRRAEKPAGQPSSGSKPSVTPAVSPEAAIQELIDAGRHKTALEQAKSLHKQDPSPRNEALLEAAYLARIRGMMNGGMFVEAVALMDLVAKRFPGRAAELEQLRFNLLIREENWPVLLKMFLDESLPKERRESITQAIYRRGTDLKGFAGSPVLPADHPLKVAATALEKAFSAVTEGPVEEALLALPEVSRRSPLAPWKTLVRAIAAFYRRDDATALKLTAAIPIDSAPGRLVPVIKSMVNQPIEGTLSVQQNILINSVLGPAHELRQLLHSTEEGLRNTLPPRNFKKLLSRILGASRDYSEELGNVVNYYLAIRSSAKTGEHDSVVYHGLDDSWPAEYWMLAARATEMMQEEPLACWLWEQFLVLGVKEGRFAASSSEVAAVSLRMANLLSLAEYEGIWDSWRYFTDAFPANPALHPDKKKSPFLPESLPTYLNIAELYRRAAEATPRREIYLQWLQWCQDDEHSDYKDIDQILWEWSRAMPQNPEPLLRLSETAEKRNALKKALKFLLEAEAIDAVNPEVRRTRLRLEVGVMLRHLKDRKLHLASDDLTRLEALPQITEGSRPAVAAVLRFLYHTLSEDEEASEEAARELTAAAGDERLALYLRYAVGALVNFSEEKKELRISKVDALTGRLKNTFNTAVWGCNIGLDVGLSLPLLPHWEKHFLKYLKKKKGPSTPLPLLRKFGENALAVKLPALAYAVSTVGIKHDGPEQPWFMLLRARSMVRDFIVRIRSLCAAAIQLGRRNGDTEVVDFAINYLRKIEERIAFRRFFVGIYDDEENEYDMEPAHIECLIKREANILEHNDYSSYRFDQHFPECPCEDCKSYYEERYEPPPAPPPKPEPRERRPRRQEAPSPFEQLPLPFDLDDGLDEPFDEGGDDAGLPATPRQIIQMMKAIFPEVSERALLFIINMKDVEDKDRELAKLYHIDTELFYEVMRVFDSIDKNFNNNELI
jgi:hypothetical protein